MGENMYEYKIVKVEKFEMLEDRINQLANEGWRLISNVWFSNFVCYYVLTFEREKK